MPRRLGREASRTTSGWIESSGVWTDEEFWFWGDGKRVSSPDGAVWTETEMATPMRIGPVARSDEGTLVAVNDVWLGYESQQFLRSEDDGLTWEVLPAGAFAGGHSIFFITFGYAEPSELCPLP